MAGLKSKMLARGRKMTGKSSTNGKASSSSAAAAAAATSSTAAPAPAPSSDAARAAAVAKLAAIRKEKEAASLAASSAAATAAAAVEDVDSPSNRTAATSAMATPSPTASAAGADADGGVSSSSGTVLDYSREGEGEVEAAAVPRTAADVDDTDVEDNEDGGGGWEEEGEEEQQPTVEESLDLTGTLEEVNQILGIVPGGGTGAGDVGAAAAGATAAAAGAGATTAAVAKLAAVREKSTAAAAPVADKSTLSDMMDYTNSYDYTSYDDDDEEDSYLEPEVGIEVQLEEPSLDGGGDNIEAESTTGGAGGTIGGIGSGIVIQEPKEEKTLPVEEEEEEEDEEYDEKDEEEEEEEEEEKDEVSKAELDGERAGQTKVAEPLQTATKAEAAVPTQSEAQTPAPVVTPEAVAAASGAAVAAAAVAATLSDANADVTAAAAAAAAAPPAQKGPGLGVSKFADAAGPALDEFSTFVNTIAASVTEAVQPGLDSVRKTLNFGTASPSPPTAGEEGSTSVVAGAAAAVAAVAGVAAAAVAGAGAASVDKDKTPEQTADKTATGAVVTPAVAPAVTPGAPIAAVPSADGDNDTSFGSKASGAAKTLLAAFNCASNDTTAPNKDAEGGQQPVETSPSSNSLFESPSSFTSAARAEEDAATARFLKEITEEGIVLLLHQAPNPTGSNPTSDWTQKIVRLYMKPGSGETVQPKLVWARNKSLPFARKKTGMPEAEVGEKKIRWTSLDLLGIHSIMGAADGDKPTDDAAETEKKENDEEAGDDNASGEGEKSCFFTITSGKGAVFVFEAMTPEERDRVSKGLQSVITGLAHALIAGDVDKYAAIVKDARDEEAEEEGELPSLRTPAQALNDIAHSLLD